MRDVAGGGVEGGIWGGIGTAEVRGGVGPGCGFGDVLSDVGGGYGVGGGGHYCARGEGAG